MNGLHGLNILILESRRAVELSTLIRGYGGTPMHAPSMRELKPDLSTALNTLERGLRTADIGVLVCMTAVGTRLLLREFLARWPEHLVSLQQVPLLAQNAAVEAVLASFGLKGTPLACPHGWAQVQAYLDAHVQAGQQVMIVEYGDSLPRLMQRELEMTGLRVTTLATCRPSYPLNPGPLAHAVRECILGGPDVLILSNGVQLLHFLKFAESLKLLEEARQGLNRLVTVSIGSNCTEIATELGVRIDLQPTNPRFDGLVEYAATHVPTVLQERYPLRRTS